MSAAGERIVNRNDVAWPDLNFAQGGSHGHGHAAEVHRHVIALRDHSSG